MTVNVKTVTDFSDLPKEAQAQTEAVIDLSRKVFDSTLDAISNAADLGDMLGPLDKQQIVSGIMLPLLMNNLHHTMLRMMADMPELLEGFDTKESRETLCEAMELAVKSLHEAQCEDLAACKKRVMGYD